VKSIQLILIGSLLCISAAPATPPVHEKSTVASWYGEEHRGKLMANGEPFDPDRLTAASWFYPLGTQVRVTAKNRRPNDPPGQCASVVVTITDRGPAKRLVRAGRKIDLAEAAFRVLADPELGLIEVTIAREPKGGT